MDQSTIVAMAKGLATYVPVVNQWSGRHTGGTVSARYCYSVWLRHLSLAHAHGMPAPPRVVAELGPGDSLGTGLAALLSGAEQLFAFDVVKYADRRRDLLILEELLEMFRRRLPIPGDDEFPEVKPRLASYAFPHDALPEARLEAALEPDRVAHIRAALSGSPPLDPLDGGPVRYFVPWSSGERIEPESVDFVYSQAVLEHVNDPDETYRALRRWLKPGGFMSHQIDYRSHGLAGAWNGHWGHSDTVWRVIRGRKPYLLNRLAHSCHLASLRSLDLEIVAEVPARMAAGVPRERLAPRFAGYTDDDLTISGALILSRKPPG